MSDQRCYRKDDSGGIWHVWAQAGYGEKCQCGGKMQSFGDVVIDVERPQERPQPFTPEQVNEAIRWCDDAGGMFRTEFAPMLREFARLLAEREAQPAKGTEA